MLGHGRYADDCEAYLKDFKVVKPTWIFPCTDSKQRCFHLETYIVLK